MNGLDQTKPAPHRSRGSHPMMLKCGCRYCHRLQHRGYNFAVSEIQDIVTDKALLFVTKIFHIIILI